jgi:hypothetical protein
MKRVPAPVLYLTFLAASLLAASPKHPTNRTTSEPLHRSHLSTAPLPETLNLKQFADHHSAIDCFITKQGVSRRLCNNQAVFCYLARNTGKTPAKIGAELARGKASKLDL